MVNHCNICCDGVYLECNEIVADNTIVPTGAYIDGGVVFERDKNKIK